jgi:hypothetical protein
MIPEPGQSVGVRGLYEIRATTVAYIGSGLRSWVQHRLLELNMRARIGRRGCAVVAVDTVSFVGMQ